MQTFISKTLEDILKNTKSFEDTVFILPSQRAGVFLKNELKNSISVGFLPKIINIEEFVSEVSGLEKIDSVELLFHFYTIYKSVEKNPDSFDEFSSWAFTVLQDFSEIDQHLVNTKDIFIYLRDISRLKKWSVRGEFKETELIKNYYSFTEKLNEYYNAFYAFLLEQKIGYQGILYREAVKNISSYIVDNTHKKFFFMGFNALNKAEEILVQELLLQGNTQIYWDIDQVFLKNNHQAGRFVKRYKKTWTYYEKNTLKTVEDNFLKDKNIQIIGASKNITQIKYAGEILSKLETHENTAFVLADETLLPITLNSLPKNLEAINITMGYPLKDIPITNLFFSIFRLFLSQEKLNKVNQNLFYHKNVIQFLREPLIYRLLSSKKTSLSDEISDRIAKGNNTFVSEKLMLEVLTNIDSEIQKVITSIFNKFTSVDEFLIRIINLITVFSEQSDTLEKEYLHRFQTIFTQLQNLQLKFGYFTNLKILHQFFKQLIASEKLSFKGEPLQGLQLMGMLETRMLDFENIILTSVNENILPANSKQNSFVPFDVKLAFGLPTYREKDAIFSYHFFRLLQRAKNIYILYNTENDSFGSGEISRFVKQLELMRADVKTKIIAPKVVTESVSKIEIEKNNLVLEKLKELAENGISPSAIATYLYNPVKFYKQKILKIHESDQVEEEVGYNTLGTVVHDTLDELYQPFIGKFLTTKGVVEMKKNTKKTVNKYFVKHFKNGDISTGKNRLIYEVAIRFIENFLSKEQQLVSDKNNSLKIIATEENLSTEINVEGIDFPIKIHGQVDRVDQLNGITRIIDYKTGMVKTTDLKLTDFANMHDYKYSKAIQVLVYSYLYTKSKNISEKQSIQAGIYSFKNLNSGFLQMNFSSNSKMPDTQVTQEKLAEFIAELKQILKEIYDVDTSFVEPLELAF